MTRTLTDNVAGLKFEFVQDEGCDYYTGYKYERVNGDWHFIIAHRFLTKEDIFKVWKIRL